MIVNPSKFQAMIINRSKTSHALYNLNLSNQIIKSTVSVLLLGVKIDSKLYFDMHISKIYKKTRSKINPAGRIQKYLDGKEKETFINTFIIQTLTNCPLVCHFPPGKF